jgi:predicted RNA-binding Zn ribbon-like protein
VQRAFLLVGSPQPGGREGAPGGLRLVQDFVNTIDREHGPDLLDEPGGLSEWLAARELAAPAAAIPLVTQGDLERARELREALRALLLANHGEPVGADATQVLERVAERAALRLRIGPGGAALSPVSRSVEGALGAVVVSAAVAMWDGTWQRLKACPRTNCNWAFYDRSPNASATWCSMSVCGQREKSGAYYRRRRATSARPS